MAKWRFTRTVGARNASTSRTQRGVNTTTAYNAEYVDQKTKEINSFKLPKQNDSERISINGEDYRVSHAKTGDGRHIVDIIRTSDGYSLGREVFTKSGSYGSARTSTRAQVQRSVRKVLLDLLNK